MLIYRRHTCSENKTPGHFYSRTAYLFDTGFSGNFIVDQRVYALNSGDLAIKEYLAYSSVTSSRMFFVGTRYQIISCRLWPPPGRNLLCLKHEIEKIGTETLIRHHDTTLYHTRQYSLSFGFSYRPQELDSDSGEYEKDLLTSSLL